MAGTGVNLVPNFLSHGTVKKNLGRTPPPDALVMDNLETFLATTVDKASGNATGSMLERFIKNRSPTMFGHPEYSLDGPGPSISVLCPHEDFSTVLLGYG